MAAPLDAPWNNNTITDAVLGEVTVGKGTSFPSTWEVGRMFLRTDQGNVYFNNGTEGTPSWVLVSGKTPDFGTGDDGNATDPALTGPIFKQYGDLTITSGATWSGTGTIVVKVSGTLTLNGTITINNQSNCGAGSGGNGGSNGGDGGDGAVSDGVVIILAETITGTGTITSTGANGSNGGNASAPSTQASGNSGNDSDSIYVLHSKNKSGLGTRGAVSDTTVRSGGVGGGEDNTTQGGLISLYALINSENVSGAGGSEGAERNISSFGHVGCAGAGGGGTPIGKGGDGGDGGDVDTTDTFSAGGSGGGGAAAAFVVIITNSLSAINVNLTGGNGGNGGNGAGNEGCGGAGGGGGAACCVIIADADNEAGTRTGGSGGTAGTSGGTPTIAPSNGSDGTARKLFIDVSSYNL